ncbi:MAG TPA: alanine racemase [Candidatus Sulfotelmatobacter sp.]|nr:alanine racemase [Candidatus Sulfotelmatobacter sp.]
MTPMRWAEVDVAALHANAAAIRRHVAPHVQVMAMIKANGYGHGALLAARAAVGGGASWLGVSSPEEALQLRGEGINVPILTVGWTHPDHHRGLIDAGIQMTVYDARAVEEIAASALRGSRPARVHVKIDSGMGRLGARPEHVPELVDALQRSRPAVEVAGVFTHFADAEGSDLGFTEQQHERFLELAGRVKEIAPEALLHCANSAATLRLPDTHHDLVRPGLALYGYAPAALAGIVPLRRVMTVAAHVTHVKMVRRGDTVGYGRTWTASGDTRVATVSAGYADGVQRAQSNRGRVVIAGRRCPIIGRVSMDQLTADVSAVGDVRPGDEVLLFGARDGALGADEVAAAAGTVPYEVLCTVSARVPRIPVGAPSASAGATVAL